MGGKKDRFFNKCLDAPTHLKSNRGESDTEPL